MATLREYRRHSTYTWNLTRNYLEMIVDYAHRAHKAEQTPYPVQAAVVFLMLDLDRRGELRSQMDYARLWGWSRKQVRTRWQSLLDEVHLLSESFGRKKRGQSRANQGPPEGQQGATMGPARGQQNGQSEENSQESGHRGASKGPPRGQPGATEGPGKGQHTNTAPSTQHSEEEGECPPREHAREDPGQKARDLDAEAERIYQAFPRKAGKKKALTEIRYVLKRGRDPTELRRKVERYAEIWRPRLRADPNAKKFIPYPRTWFHQGRYDDDESAWKDDAEYEQHANPTSNGAHQRTPERPRTDYQRRRDFAGDGVPVENLTRLANELELEAREHG